MKQVMITVCCNFGSKYWVPDIVFTCIARLSSALGQNGYEVVYADSMDSMHMRSFAAEADFARDQLNGNGILFVIYKDELRENNLYAAFDHLREVLPRRIALVLIDIGNSNALTFGQICLLNQLKGLYFLHGRKGTDKETVKILLRDIASGI